MAVSVECAFEIIARSSNRCPTESWRAVESAIVVQHVFIYCNVGCKNGIYSVVAVVHFVGKPIKFGCVANSVVSNEIGCKIQTAVIAFGYQSSALIYELSTSSAVSCSSH